MNISFNLQQKLLLCKERWLQRSGNQPEILILTITPLVMALVNASWLYSPMGWLDPWYNVGYFLHYDDPLFLNDYYKVSRLSWIIPGYVLYHLFTPVVANFVLHIGCLILSAVLFYLAIQKLFGRQIAFVTAALLVVYVRFHGSGGWDYQTAGSGVYYLATFLLITRAAFDERRDLNLVLAGAAFAATLHADILFINMAPALFLHFTILSKVNHDEQISLGRLAKVAALLAFGFAALTLLLCLINYIVGRDFIFFRSMVNLVIAFITEPHKNQAAWALPWSSGWFLQPSNMRYLAIPAAIFLMSFVFLGAWACGWKRAQSRVSISLIVQYQFTALLWIVWQSLGHTALQPSYFLYPLLPVAFLALAGMAAYLQTSKRDEKVSLLFYGLIAAILVAPLSVPFFNLTLRQLVGRYFAQNIGATVATLTLLAIVVLALARNRRTPITASVVLFSMINFISADGAEISYVYNQRCKDAGDGYLALIDSNMFLTAFAPGLRGLSVWWDNEEILKNEQNCTMKIKPFAFSMTSFGAVYLSNPWPNMPSADELPEDAIKSVDPSTKIAVPTADPANIDRLIGRFERSGVKLTVEGRRIVRTAPFSFYLYVLAPAATGQAAQQARPPN